jgi:hypothetical protein
MIALAVVLCACGDGGAGSDGAPPGGADGRARAGDAGGGSSTPVADGQPNADATGAPDAAPRADGRVDGDTLPPAPDATRPVADGLPPAPDSISRDVGPAGGVLEFGGVRLVVPPRALVEVLRLRISYAEGAGPEGYVLRSPVYRFEPVGTRFAVPASLTMAFEGPAAELGLFWSRAEGDGYERLDATVTGSALRGPIEHFSEGFVAEYVVDDCPDDPAKQTPGACGCGTPDDDMDGDGTADCLDGCPDDPDLQTPNDCGACGPAPVERCNGLDDDCDGAVDDGFDVGRGCEVGAGACRQGGRIACAADGTPVCDAVAGVPAVERCDGLDNDCDGGTDEDFDLGTPCSAGVGACRRQGVLVCGADGASRCNAVAGRPGVERCNTLDDDCDGETDESDAVDAPLWYRDADGDGHGLQADVRAACEAPEGRVAAPDDCDDTEPAVHPGVAEACNERDDDCDGLVDEGLADADSDGVPDCRDGCPGSREKLEPGLCGCAAVETGADPGALPVCRLPETLLPGWLGEAGAWTTVRANPVTNEVLMAGRLDMVGQATGQAALFNRAGERLPGLSRFDGTVRTAMADGAGGWFVGGGFRRVGGHPRFRLVHLLADGSVDSDWGRDVYVGAGFGGWNGDIGTLVADPVRGRLIAGGRFDFVGPWTGPSVRVDARTGDRLESAVGLGTFRVSGWVFDAVPDGTGGWFIAGRFDAAGHAARTNLAHLLPDGRPDPTWDAAVEGYSVEDIELVDGVLYLVGNVDRVGGEARANAAAVDAASGRVLPWNPAVLGTVSVLAVTSGAVYLGGGFVEVGGQPRARLVAVDRESGALLPGMLDADGEVNALAQADGAVFVGGRFQHIAGQVRAGLASIDAATGLLTDWAPPVRRTAGRVLTPEVKTLAAGDGALYVVGSLDGVGDELRDDACAFDTVTGALLPWRESIDGRYGPRIWLVGQRLVVSLGVLGRNFVLDLNPDDELPAMELNIPGDVYAVAARGDELLLGGDFESYAPSRRSNIAAFDLRTGQPTSFDPGANGEVHALALTDDRLYVGGAFTTFAGQARAHVAAVDPSTDALLAWAPEPAGDVRAVAASGRTVFLGGSGLMAVDARTGAATPFGAQARIGGNVSALLVGDGVLYAGGDIDTFFADPPVRNVVALDLATGARLWDADRPYVSPVTALARAGDALLVGTTLGLRSVEVVHGSEQPWPAAANGEVDALAVDGDRVFAGGAFTLTGTPGSGVFVSGSTGEIIRPLAVGASAATVDSTGRWYLAGAVGSNGDIPAIGFTRLRPDGSVDPSWRSEVVLSPYTRISTMAVDERRGQLLAAGNFAAVGTPTGGGAWLDSASGALRSPSPDARFVGAVAASVPDGAGGWFVGGDFTAVGDLPVRGLAHLRADGTLDAAWRPSPDAAVRALALADGVLYVGGSFTELGGLPRERLAALDPATGEVLPWNPGANDRVNTLALDGGSVFVGGHFTQLGGQVRNRLAAVNALSGEVTPWDPDADGAVRQLVVAGGTVYAAGGNGGESGVWGFGRVGGLSRWTLAAIDAATGEVLPWDPMPEGGAVHALDVSAGTVYLGGDFRRVGGQDRILLAAVDAATGAVNGWNPGPDRYAASLGIFAVDVFDGQVYVGGSFYDGDVAAAHRSGVAALDTVSGAATALAPRPFGPVRALTASPAGLFLGGSFESPGEIDRVQFLAVDLESGALTPWRPDLRTEDGQGPGDLELAGDAVLVGGRNLQTAAGVRLWNDLMAVDAVSAANRWPVPTDLFRYPSNIDSVAVWNGAVYTKSGEWGMALDLATAALTPWAPHFGGAHGQTSELAASEGLVYVNGVFVEVDGRPRAGLAAIDAVTGAVADWAPGDRGGGFVEVIHGRVHTGGPVYCTATPCEP